MEPKMKEFTIVRKINTGNYSSVDYSTTYTISDAYSYQEQLALRKKLYLHDMKEFKKITEEALNGSD